MKVDGCNIMGSRKILDLGVHYFYSLPSIVNPIKPSNKAHINQKQIAQLYAAILLPHDLTRLSTNTGPNP